MVKLCCTKIPEKCDYIITPKVPIHKPKYIVVKSWDDGMVNLPKFGGGPLPKLKLKFEHSLSCSRPQISKLSLHSVLNNANK